MAPIFPHIADELWHDLGRTTSVQRGSWPLLDEQYLVKVGNSIRGLIDNLKSKYAQQDIKYVVIIEGMASNDNFSDNFPLSYKRAWAVLKLWQERNIVLDPTVCEVQVAGSGTEGIGRYPSKEEYKNQRILIQIVPKIGEIKIE